MLNLSMQIAAEIGVVKEVHIPLLLAHLCLLVVMNDGGNC